MDAYFEFEGEKIGVMIMPDSSPVRKVKGIEKMSGWLNFYNSRGHCGTIAFYEDYDDMTPISWSIFEKYYLKMIKEL